MEHMTVAGVGSSIPGELTITHEGETFVLTIQGYGELRIDHEAAWRILDYLEGHLCA